MTDEHRYYAVKGARFSDKDAHELGTAFDEIEDLCPKTVVAAARAPKSPIHCYFEWDNKVAGGLWREHQAGTYLRNLRIELVSTGEIVRAFHPIVVKPNEPSSYKHIDIIANNAEWAQQIKDRAVKDLEASQRRLRQYSALGDAFVEILDGPVQDAIDQLKELPVGAERR